MEYQVKTLPKSEVEITITVSPEEMEKYRKKAAEDISKDVKVKGFRPGHVPVHVLEQHVDKKYLIAHTQEVAIQRSYADVVIKDTIQVVSRPKVKIEKDEPFTFTATVAVMPEVKIKDYADIKVDKKEIKVEKKEIDAVVDDMKKYGTIYKDVDRAAKKGDRVEVDFEGFDEKGKSVENTKSSNHPVVLGENTLIPGFEEKVEGMKKDEKKEFDLTFPKDYHKKDFQNKKLKFKVELKRIEEPKIPELNEELIEKLTGKKQSPEEFKKEIEANIQAKKEQEEKQRRENDYLEKLLKKAEVEIPEPLVHEEVHFIIQDMKEDIEKKGHQFDKFLAQMKMTEDDLHKKYHEEAEKRVKTRLVVQKIIEMEKIEISPEEMKKEIERVKSFYPEDQHKKIAEDFEKGELKNQIMNRLLIRKFFEKFLK